MKNLVILILFGCLSAVADSNQEFSSDPTEQLTYQRGSISGFLTPYYEKYPEQANGLRVNIKALVNGKKQSSSQVVVNFSDHVELMAQFSSSGRNLKIGELENQYELTYWWYKVIPSDRAFQDPAALGDYSEAAQFLYRNYTPFIKKKLSFKYYKFTKEYNGIIGADFAQSSVKAFSRKNKRAYVGTLRWKVLVYLKDRNTGDGFYLTSPDERHLNGEFDKINYSGTRKVFLLARRGGTAFKKYNEALSYLGLPYIWWRRSVRYRLGSTCSQFVSYSVTGRDQNTAKLFRKKGITVTDIVGGKYKGRVGGKEVFLEYGKHVNPGQIIVYRHGLIYRHAAVIGDDHGAYAGFLDTDDMMIHGIIGGILAGNFLKTGLEYVRLGKRYHQGKVRFTDKSGKTHLIMKIVR